MAGYFKRFGTCQDDEVDLRFAASKLNKPKVSSCIEHTYVVPYTDWPCYSQGPLDNNPAVAVVSFIHAWVMNNNYDKIAGQTLSINCANAVAYMGNEEDNPYEILRSFLITPLYREDQIPGNNKGSKALEAFNKFLESDESDLVSSTVLDSIAETNIVSLDLEDITYAIINMGPVLARIRLPKQYEKMNTFINEELIVPEIIAATDEYDVQTVVIYGFTKTGWIVRNTWGPNFGINGSIIVPWGSIIDAVALTKDSIFVKDDEDEVVVVSEPVPEEVVLPKTLRQLIKNLFGSLFPKKKKK